MQSPCRPTLVSALDDLGERDALTYDQRTTAEMPYPSPVVDERLEALRRRRWVAWGLLGLSGALVAVAHLGSGLGWAITEAATAFLIMTIPLAAHGTRTLVYCGKAEQLYALLYRVDKAPAAAEPDRAATT